MVWRRNPSESEREIGYSHERRRIRRQSLGISGGLLGVASSSKLPDGSPDAENGAAAKEKTGLSRGGQRRENFAPDSAGEI